METISRQEAKAKGLTRYYTGKPCKRGHVAERYVSNGHCVECDKKRREANSEKYREYHRKRYEANPEKNRERARKWREANPEKSRERSRKWGKANPEKRFLIHAKNRARKKGVPFSLTPQDITIPARCPVFGTKLLQGKGKVGPNSPTLDRIEPSLGYVKGNIVVMSQRANSIKNNASPEELAKVSRFLTTFRLRKVAGKV